MTEEEFIEKCAEETIKKIPFRMLKTHNKREMIERLKKDEKFKNKCLELLKNTGNQQATTD